MFGTGFLLGIVGGMHCIVMCSPVVFALQPDRSFLKTTIYHAGRLGVYILLGLFAGMLGDGLAWFGLQRFVSVAMGAIMILITVLPATRSRFYQVSLSSKPVLWFRRKLANTGKGRSFIAGMLNGMLPCGLVYVALTGSLALGNSGNAGLFMAGFGIGTVPWLTGAVASASFLPAGFKQRASRAIPYLAIAFGILFILRGLALDIPYISPALQSLGLPEEMTICH
ncbi:MAG: sulfite exporter TauE/SafE family protein [Cyclobacteriaceae bacterium]